MHHPFRLLLSVLLCFPLAAACEGSAGNGDGRDAATADGNVGIDSGIADSGAAQPCSDTAPCPGTGVCHPFLEVCVDPGASCVTHDDCTGGTYCDPELHVCLAGSTGSPCSSSNNCTAMCIEEVCGCDGIVQERILESAPLDIYFILDRTGSMGTDCSYVAGNTPPVNSKACYATYALSDYLIGVTPAVDTRLAFQFMSQPNDCNGVPYQTPLVGLTSLPVAANHGLIQQISNETFAGGLGTHIEGALRGLAAFTSANQTPGREMIGVLMTDGDPQGCMTGTNALRDIIANHYASTGIRIFIIGMEGATESKLEIWGAAGGADGHDDWCGGVTTPCHYWTVGDGSGEAIESALQAIAQQAVPLPCEFGVTDLTPPPGQSLDWGKVNVTFTQGTSVTTIGQVPNAAACPAGVPAWYYDNPASPTKVQLCPVACGIVSDAGDNAKVNVVVGCDDTVILI